MTPDDVIWRSFLDTLVRHAGQLLRPQTRPVVDAEDVVASAVGSFLARCDDAAPTPDDSVLALLLDCVRRHCEKWNMRSRRHPFISLNASASEPNEPAAPPSFEEQTRYFDDLIAWLAKDLIDTEKEILLLLIGGEPLAEISKRVGRVERTIRRCRDKIVSKLRVRASQDSGSAGASPASPSRRPKI